MIKMTNKVKAIAQTKQDYILFNNGLDLVTPSNQTKPGSLRTCINYEIDQNGGYRGVRGYERFDGRSLSTSALFIKFNINLTGTILVGDTVTDNGTGATGKVLEINDTQIPGTTYLIVTYPVLPSVPVGVFTNGNDLHVVGKQADILENGIISGGPTAELTAYYETLAQDNWRPNITAVPGSGSVLGVYYINSTVYAVRNKVGELTAGIYYSTPGGWVEVDLGLKLAFTQNGTTEIFDGDTIEGVTSGSTAVVRRVATTGGNWATPNFDAYGYFYFQAADQSAPFEVGGEDIKIGATTVGTITGDSEAIVLLPDGRYEFITYNFSGGYNENIVYGVDGVNPAFELDTTLKTIAQITIGVTPEAPTHVAAHKEHLWLGFGASILYSAVGDPHNWQAIRGAGEISVGDIVTGLLVQPGSKGSASLAAISRNRVHIVYGTPGTSDFDVVQYRERVGALPGSIQELGFTIFLDDRGILSLETAQEFGNFRHAVLSKDVYPYMIARKNIVTTSCVSQDKSQYRLYFQDNTALYMTTFNSKVLGIMTIEFANPVLCSIASEGTADGVEITYFGSDTGYVYLMDSGTSFDGLPIPRSFSTNFAHMKSPRVEKTFFDVSFEVTGEGYSRFNMRYELDYALVAETPQGFPTDIPVNFSSPVWDDFVWDNFVWDGTILSPSNVGLDGSGENISIIIESESTYYQSITISGALLRYAIRKQLRS